MTRSCTSGGRTWQPVGWEQLARLIADELTLATGVANDEFAAQVRQQPCGDDRDHRGQASLEPPGRSGAQPVGGPADPAWTGTWPASRRWSPGTGSTPRPRPAAATRANGCSFAPEAGARFPLRFLAVRGDALTADGDTTGLDRLGSPAAPPGYHVLPAHPWQLRLLAERAWLRQAFRDRLLIDLGAGPREVVPTSSVRTVYDPVADVFCKFSLNVRITNCVRKNSWYELAGAVALTKLLGPVFDDLAARFPGTAMLGEPGYRTVALADEEAAEGLSVIVREGLRGGLAPGVTPVLAACPGRSRRLRRRRGAGRPA